MIYKRRCFFLHRKTGIWLVLIYSILILSLFTVFQQRYYVGNQTATSPIETNPTELLWSDYDHPSPQPNLGNEISLKIKRENRNFLGSNSPNFMRGRIISKSRLTQSPQSSSTEFLTESTLSPRVFMSYRPNLVAPTHQMTRRISPEKNLKVLPVWPEQTNRSDRILEQLRYKLPRGLTHNGLEHYKRIYLAKGIFPNWASMGYGAMGFQSLRCPVASCYLTDADHQNVNQNDSFSMEGIDAVLYRDTYPSQKELEQKRDGQVWIFYSLESPKYRSKWNWTLIGDAFDWTATYRIDSTIVTPYDKYVPGNRFVPDLHGRAMSRDQILEAISKMAPDVSFVDGDVTRHVVRLLERVYLKNTTKNYASGKGRMVAWFVSNCYIPERLWYVSELRKYIAVDVYGDCGDLICPKSNGRECYDMLNRDYKFYLSFENSRCKDYVTEKFFDGGLKNDIIPIVMGPTKQDYLKVAPHQSFIHVNDFPNPAHLAYFLYILASNDHIYNSYLAWKELENGSFVDTKFWCRLCAMLHHPGRNRRINDFYSWWNGPGICS